MAVHSLKPATDRRLGKPLPYQPANQTRAHPILPELFTLYHAVLCAYAVLAPISKCYPPVQGRLPTRYSPVRHSCILLPAETFRRMHPFDLHVLGTPPAFILSQDQTLMLVCLPFRLLPAGSAGKFSLLRLSFPFFHGLYCFWAVAFATVVL